MLLLFQEKLSEDERHSIVASTGLTENKAPELIDLLDESNISSHDTVSTLPDVLKFETANDLSSVVSPDIMQDKNDNKFNAADSNFAGLVTTSTAVPFLPDKTVPCLPIASTFHGKQDFDITENSSLVEFSNKTDSVVNSDVNQNGTRSLSAAKAGNDPTQTNLTIKVEESITQVRLAF